MKGKHYILLVVTSVCLHTQFTSAQVWFQKIIGGSEIDRGYSVKKTGNSGYIISGETASYAMGDSCGALLCPDAFLLKLDSDGNEKWTKTYGGNGSQNANSVAVTADGGYIIGGGGVINGTAGYILIKTDSSGDTLWTKLYEGTDEGKSVIETSDSGILLVGRTMSYGAGVYDMYLVKTDGNGQLMWAKTIGGGFYDGAWDVVEAPDGFLLVGGTNSYGAGSTNVYVVKTDTNGNLVWAKTYGGSTVEEGHAISETSDGNYLICASTKSFGTGELDVYLIKINSDGDLLWAKTYGSSYDDLGLDIATTSDHGFVITGSTHRPGVGSSDLLLFKIDASGELKWSKAYGGYGSEFGNGVVEADQKGYVIVGETASFGSGNFNDIYIIKTDSLGYSGGCNEYDVTLFWKNPITQLDSGGMIDSVAIENTAAILVVDILVKDSVLCETVGLPIYSNKNSIVEVYPNPNRGNATIEIYLPEGHLQGQLKIIDMLGVTHKVMKVESGHSDFSLLKNDLPSSGIYFCILKANNQVVDRVKFICLR